MYTEADYGRFNFLMKEYVDTLEFDPEFVYWTGFKMERDSVNVLVPVPAKGSVSQWIGMSRDKKRRFYVTIPGVVSGEWKQGENFKTIDERVFPAQDAKTISDTKVMIRTGLAKLQELIEAEGA